jgi:hypothetical protein
MPSPDWIRWMYLPSASILMGENMKIGDTVLAKVNSGQWTCCQIIDIKGNTYVVSGYEELNRAKEAGRPPVGVGLPRQLVKEK